MSDPTIKEFTVTGGALKKPNMRRGTRKNRKQDGGDNTGALMQLSADRVPQMPSNVSGSILSNVQKIMASNFGPGKIQQMGGDNTGGLQQVALTPEGTPGPMNTQAFQRAFQAEVGSALQKFGPDSSALQSGGKKQKGGDGIAGTIQLRANQAVPPVIPGSPQPVPVISGESPEGPAPVGGARIFLKAPKRKTRIALKEKKSQKGGTCSATGCMAGGSHTRKARKIHLRVKGVTSRLAKAKKAKRQAMAASIGEVKTRLEKAGIIKKDSKAPESMLRTMYADLLITKKGL
jgi:hypothetical protein